MKLSEILAQIQEKSNAVATIFDEVDEKHNGEMPDDGRERIIALNKEIADLEKRAVDLKGDEAIREANERRRQEFQTPVKGPSFPNGKESSDDPQRRGGRRGDVKSFGQMFVANDDWKTFFKQIAPTGQVGDKTRVQSPSMLMAVGIKTLLTGVSDSSAGAFVIPEQSGIYDPLGRRPLTIRDIISIRTTSSDLVEYVRQTSRENAAAPVAEATSASGSSGVKPEGGFGFERVQAPVKTIAEWVPATKRALSDAGQLSGIIDDELRADLEEEVEDQTLTGDGTGENFEGLDAVSGTQDQAYDTSLLVTTRKARTKIRVNGRTTPTAFVFNPTDWETIDLLMDGENRFYFGGPTELGTPRLWGLPVVECEGQPSGNGWVGDWKKAVLWDREQATISVSDAHADFFIRNLVAILGELRAAFGVIRPAAFCEIDLTP